MQANLVYLLMQDGKILDASHSPAMVDVSQLDRAKSWQILLAAECDGTRRIAKPIVVYRANSKGTVYYISSDMDGMFRLVGKAEDSVTALAVRISSMFTNGRFDADPKAILAGIDVEVGAISLIEAINPRDFS